MRKSLYALGAVVALVVLLPAVPSSAGDGVQRSTTVTKAVDGTGPGGQFGFEIDCDDDISNFGLVAGESTTGSGDANTCTVTEVDDRGADAVAYTCQVLTGEAMCSADGRSVAWPGGEDGTAEITVTNTFIDATTTTTSTTTTVAPTTTAAAAAAQATQPAFTG